MSIKKKIHHPKSAALLITLLIISTIGLLAIITLRSSLVSMANNLKIADSLQAEELAQAGLEYGLSKCVNSTNDKAFLGDFLADWDHEVSTSGIYPRVKVYWAISGSANPTLKGCTIISVGMANKDSVRKHEVYWGDGFVGSACVDTTPVTKFCTDQGYQCGPITYTDACQVTHNANCPACPSGTCVNHICSVPSPSPTRTRTPTPTPSPTLTPTPTPSSCSANGATCTKNSSCCSSCCKNGTTRVCGTAQSSCTTSALCCTGDVCYKGSCTPCQRVGGPCGSGFPSCCTGSVCSSGTCR